MNRLLLPAVAFASLLAAGCLRAGSQAPASAAQRPRGAAAVSAADRAVDAREAPRASEEARPTKDESARGRMPGDYVAFRFTGSSMKTPIVLTQRVVAREGDDVVVDMTLEGGSAAETLRVRMSDAPSTRGEIVGVAWLDGDEERAATMAAYESMMAKTVLAADANDEVLGSEAVTVQIAGAHVACQKTSYRVRVGKTRATLRTLQSDAFAWGDVGGDITADDGRVLYRAELIEAGRGQAPSATTIARSDYDD